MAGEWTTADYALIVSLCSAAVSLFSLGWNIWSKFIFPKANVEVKLAFSVAVGVPANYPSAVSLTVINHGPTEVTILGVFGLVRGRWLFGKTQRALVKSYSNYPLSLQELSFGQVNGIPKRLQIGEQCTFHFPEELRKNKQLKTLGVTDGFGREHFARSKLR